MGDFEAIRLDCCDGDVTTREQDGIAFDLGGIDEIDRDKLAKAFQHLIIMFGGKKDAF